jgi:hypothetical protein
MNESNDAASMAVPCSTLVGDGDERRTEIGRINATLQGYLHGIAERRGANPYHPLQTEAWDYENGWEQGDKHRRAQDASSPTERVEQRRTAHE